MKALRLLGKYILTFLLCIIGVVKIVFYSLIKIWDASKYGYVWFGILYQVFAVLFACVPISPQVDAVIKNGSGSYILFIPISFEAIAIIIAINTLIELIFHFRGQKVIFDKIQEIQKYANNYALIIISLVALYVSAFSNTSPSDNLELLIFGVLFFISMIVNDIYRALIYSTGAVSDLYKKVKRLMQDY